MNEIKSKFASLYNLKGIDQKKINNIIEKFGDKTVNYTLDRLASSGIPYKCNPYTHLALVCDRMAKAYQRAIDKAQGKGTPVVQHKNTKKKQAPLVHIPPPVPGPLPRENFQSDPESYIRDLQEYYRVRRK
jgi:hypothetical protein